MECNICPYCRNVRIASTVIKRADLVIVGEAPGAIEIVRKNPFIGPVGKVIDHLLKQQNIDLSKVLMTNALLCRPSVGKTISREAINACAPRVINEVQISQAKVVLALGNTALYSLTGNFSYKITNEHGRVLTSSKLPGVSIVPSVHPAMVLRNPGDLAKVRYAFQYASSLMQGQEVKVPGITNYTIVTQETFEYYANLIKQSEYVAADIETGGTRILQSPILVLGVCYNPEEVLIFPAPLDRRLQEVFSCNTKWAWFNGVFDIQLLETDSLIARLDEDVMLMPYAINENATMVSLEDLASCYLGAEDYKGDIKRTAGTKREIKDVGYSNVSKEVLYCYLAKDCSYTFQLLKYFKPKVEENKYSRMLYNNLLLPAARFLQRVQRNGIYCNEDYTVALGQELLNDERELLKQINQSVESVWDSNLYKQQTGSKSIIFNPLSNQQIAWILYDVLKAPIIRGKGRSVDKNVIEHYKDTHEVIAKVGELRSLRKTFSTYVDGILDSIAIDGRVHSSFIVNATVTGRLSSRDPNMQNISSDPRIRDIFQAPPGRRLVEADYKGAELRVLAALSKDTYLTEVFQQQRDLHSEIAIQFFGADYTRAHRMMAKSFNFGIAYGRTEFTIAKDFKISIEEAQELIEKWFIRAPQAAQYLLQCDQDAREGKTLTTCFGRQRHFGVVTAENVQSLENEARNFRIQSIASDLTLIAAMQMEKSLKDLNGNIINLVHDGILIECDDDDQIVEQIITIVNNTMVEIPRIYLGSKVPFEVEIHSGYKWGSIKN